MVMTPSPDQKMFIMFYRSVYMSLSKECLSHHKRTLGVRTHTGKNICNTRVVFRCLGRVALYLHFV